MSMSVSFGNLLVGADSNGIILKSLEWGKALSAEAQEQVLSTKPSTFIKMNQLDAIKMQLVLLRGKVKNMNESITAIQDLVDSRVISPLIIGGEKIGRYRWLAASVVVTSSIFDGCGRMVQATVSLTLQEYIYAGVAGKTKLETGVISLTDADIWGMKASERTTEEKSQAAMMIAADGGYWS